MLKSIGMKMFMLMLTEIGKMKTFVILEKYVGYADVTIEAKTEQEAIDLYNEGSYSDDATEYDDMFYDFEFVEIKELTDENN